MKAIMISINKPHTDNIFSGEKTNEWRTRPLPLGKAYVYETKRGGGCGKVIGEMEIVKTYRFHTDDLIYQDTLIEQGCVPYSFVANYAKGKEYISANIIANVKKYDTPKELGEFSLYEKKDCDHFWCGICGARTQNDVINCNNLTCERKTIKRPFQSWGYVEEV